MAERRMLLQAPENYEIPLALAIVSAQDLSKMDVKNIHRFFLTVLNEIRADQAQLRSIGTLR